MNPQSAFQEVRRKTVGTSILGWIALLCLISAGAFWFMIFIQLITPPRLLSPQSVQVFILTIAFTLVLPLFWSMLLPSSPAGRLLQKQTWATPGYCVVIGAALFLTYYAGVWLRTWWYAQPSVVETGQDGFLTITSLITMIFLPALAWTIVTPEQWVAQIEQARQVRRLEQTLKLEDAAMRAWFARAVTLLNAELTNLTIEQRRELAGILGGFARIQQQAMESIAASWKDIYGIEAHLTMMPDTELLEQYRQVANVLADSSETLADTTEYAMLISPQQRIAAPSPTSHHTSQASPAGASPAPAPPPGKTIDMHALKAAQRALGATVWDRHRLEQALNIRRSKALELIKEWREADCIQDIHNPAYHYQFVEV
jgi:hypothetical protein